MSDTRKAWAQIHFCVLLWGFTAILGRLITLESLPLVLWRMALVTAALALLPPVWRRLRGLGPRRALAYAGIGVLVACHWLTFFGAVKLANASVGATCMALVPVFLSFIEPGVLRRPFMARDLWLALAAVPGVVLVVGGTPASMNLGIASGVASALFAAMFASLNKRLVHGGDPLTVTLLEMGAGALFLAAVAVVLPQADPRTFWPQRLDALWLAVLAFGCTLLPFALSLVALRHLSAYATALAVNMEPVYAIVLAIVLLGEQRELDLWFYAGAGLILAVVFMYPLLARRRAARQNSAT